MFWFWNNISILKLHDLTKTQQHDLFFLFWYLTNCIGGNNENPRAFVEIKKIQGYFRVSPNLLYPSELTEACGASFVSVPDVMSMVGTVGVPLPNIEVCLQSVPEWWYDTLSKSVYGEVCIKGFIFVEVNLYLLATINTNDLTGWIMSSISCKFKLCGLRAYLKEIYLGYIGEWQPDDAVKLIDRQKNIFKLSEREYVAVESLENIYSSCSFVESVCEHFPMYQARRKYELHDKSSNILLTKMTCRYRILSSRIEIQHNEGHKNGWYQIIPNIKNGCRRF